MTETVERKPTSRSRKSLSPVEQEIKAMKAYAKKISASKEESIDFLQRAGILDKKGELAEHYRS